MLLGVSAPSVNNAMKYGIEKTTLTGSSSFEVDIEEEGIGSSGSSISSSSSALICKGLESYS